MESRTVDSRISNTCYCHVPEIMNILKSNIKQVVLYFSDNFGYIQGKRWLKQGMLVLLYKISKKPAQKGRIKLNTLIIKYSFKLTKYLLIGNGGFAWSSRYSHLCQFNICTVLVMPVKIIAIYSQWQTLSAIIWSRR